MFVRGVGGAVGGGGRLLSQAQLCAPIYFLHITNWLNVERHLWLTATVRAEHEAMLQDSSAPYVCLCVDLCASVRLDVAPRKSTAAWMPARPQC